MTLAHDPPPPQPIRAFGLAINAGSSSVRLAAFDLMQADIFLRQHEAATYRGDDARRFEARQLLLTAFGARAGGAPTLIVHRVVHGGERTEATWIDAALEREIAALSPLAPLHNAAALAWIQVCRAQWPQVPQLAVFDTAFFTELPPRATAYALPRALQQQYRIRRYGFHGLAHASMWQQWSAAQPTRHGTRVISLQLGSGCSITALRDGKPIDTSMGFSPLEGLMMATRSGDLDAGILLYLQRNAGFDVATLDRLLNTESGLLGLSGISGDVRSLLQQDSAAARLAIEVYCYRARKYLGAYIAALGGVDAILFGGGVGEGSAEVRAMIAQDMDWCGIALDPAANSGARASAPHPVHRGPVEIWVVPVDEAALLAKTARTKLQARQGETHDVSV